MVDAGLIVVVSFISPFAAERAMAHRRQQAGRPRDLAFVRGLPEKLVEQGLDRRP
jgi:adenylylsulfate kinase-like enzyme